MEQGPESIGSSHRQILLKFAALTGEILEGASSLKGQRGKGGLPPDEFVAVRHRLHDLVRGIYKPSGWGIALSILLTESEANYGRELKYRSPKDWECYYLPPGRKQDVRAIGDTRALRQAATLHIPVGVIRLLSRGRYEILGLGKVRFGAAPIFKITPYTITPATQLTIEDHLNKQLERRMGSGDYSLPDRPAVAKARVAQRLWRQMLLVNYRNCCAFCGFPGEEMLVAAHIVRYADDPTNRLNPHNGILLCRLCDGGFELKMISLSQDLTPTISSALADTLENHPVGQAWLRAVRSARVSAERWPPDARFIAAHREGRTAEGTAT